MSKGEKPQLKKPISTAKWMKKVPKSCNATFSASLEISGGPFTVDHTADDLIFIREPHGELRGEPQEPARFTIGDFEQSSRPQRQYEAYHGAVSSYHGAVQTWYVEKLRYDGHKEWLIVHNEITESAQIVRCLDERLSLAAWARQMVRAPSAETGNWSSYTLEVPTQPLLAATQVCRHSLPATSPPLTTHVWVLPDHVSGSLLLCTNFDMAGGARLLWPRQRTGGRAEALSATTTHLERE